MNSAQTGLVIHMLGYDDEEKLGQRFREAVREFGYEPWVVNSVIQMFNSRYDTNIPEVEE